MYEVLVPVDADENRALNQAKHVARLPEAGEEVEATVLYVAGAEEFKQADEVVFSEIDAAVQAAEYLQESGVSVSRVVDDGGVSEQIVRTANETGADEIVMGGRKRSGVTQILLGSTVQDVLLSTEQPVTVTGDGMVLGESIQRLLVPVDTDERRARHQAEYVAGLPGDAEDVEATVLYVFPHLDYAGAPEHEFAEVDAAVGAADYLEERGYSVERVAVGGEVTTSVFEHVEELDVDGIVAGGRKRSGLQKELLGSTAQDILLSAERPVTITG